jgi:hypothetical protein
MSISNLTNLPPPTNGIYAYNTFIPTSGSFPALAGTYVDPVFGETIRRLTNIGGGVNGDEMYGHHWSNADGTFFFFYNSGVFNIRSTTTGAIVYAGQPGYSIDLAWHPTDPDKYYYWSGSALVRRNLAAQTSTTIHAFANALQPLGGSLNWIDRTGRYFLLFFNNGTGIKIQVWDNTDQILYAGEFATGAVTANGYVALSPDGQYLVIADGASSPNGATLEARLLNHTTHTIGSAHQFWNLCGDHGGIVSASDGHTYMLTVECFNTNGALYRVDVASVAGTIAQQIAAATPIGNVFPAGVCANTHFSHISRGPFSDWVWVSMESTIDSINGGITGWVALRQEIFAVNLVTLEIRRFAHHRTRGTNYSAMPRVSSSWDGSMVLWFSNYNYAPVSTYGDVYGINNPFGTGTPPDTTPPSAPTGVRIN